MGNKRILIRCLIILGIIVYLVLAVMTYSFYGTGLSVIIILLMVIGINAIALLLGTTIPVVGIFIYTFVAKRFILMIAELGNIGTSKITDFIYQVGLFTVIICSICVVALILSHNKSK